MSIKHILEESHKLYGDSGIESLVRYMTEDLNLEKEGIDIDDIKRLEDDTGKDSPI
jgi:hypothetical protein